MEEQEQDDFRLKPVVYAIPGMEEAIVQKDITYKTVDGNELKLDVYYPSDYDGETRLPAVIFVHGDGPPEFLKDAKEWGEYTSWGQLVAASGMIAVTFNHRSTEMLAKLYEAASDVDDPRLNASIARLVTVAVAKNVNIDFMNHATGHHAFDILDDDARSREIIRATLEFLRGHLVF